MADTGALKNKISKTLANLEYNDEGYWVYQKASFLSSIFKRSTQKKVTIVSPVYNAETGLRRSMDSVINQTIGHEYIEYILIDDGSTDQSRAILLEYAFKYPNITLIFLKENSGSPSYPRNLGIKFASTDYLTFLDSDDWLALDGIQTLINIAETTSDDYIVGKTIKVEDDGMTIIGEHQSVKERRSVDAFSIPNMFQHLGPPSKMIKTKVIKDNHIEFPDMKYAEDKQFFIDVLLNVKTVSTTTQTVCYVNRLGDNKSSLTTKTSIIEKTDTNIEVINYVIEKNLDVEKEKIILNRLYEFDCITRLFDRYHFFRSDNKDDYFNKFNEVLETTQKLDYDISENFFWPIHKVVYDMFLDEKQDLIAKLLRWNRTEKDKDYVIRDGIPFTVVPFMEEKYKYIEVPILAIFDSDSFSENSYHLNFRVYGEHTSSANELIFRHRNNVDIDYTFEVKKNGNHFTLEVPIDTLSEFDVATYSIFLRFNEYRRMTIMKINHNQITYENKNYKFYTTVNSNVALQIKKNK